MEKILMGDAITIHCAHDNMVVYHFEALELEVDGLRVDMEAALSENLPVPVLLGWDMPQLGQQLWRHVNTAESISEKAMLVVTWVQACMQFQKF